MATPEDITVNEEKQQRIHAYFQNQQNLPMAVGAGFGAVLISAVIWALVTVVTGYQIGWMAVGVGFLVGFAVRLGKGIDKMYHFIGAALALLGCLLGNFFSLIGFVAKEEQMNVFGLLGVLDFSKVPSLMIDTASPMDFLFYALAIYEGFRFSLRRITPAELAAAQQSII
ncbi:MAG: hypothetical protein LBK60_10445 [Verrucomicrobiales bacterium]|jgi:hypothetical protein|nr:hypothetical protein [Verrucomicrobiales bacterium]